MTVQKIAIELPADILISVNESVVELKKRIKCSLAVQLYLEQKLTMIITIYSILLFIIR